MDENNLRKIFDIDNFDILKWKFSLILSSKSPFVLWWNILSTKDDFVQFIKDLSKTISSSFTQNNDFIVSVYKDSNYHIVWANLLKRYIKDSIYFDIKQYFKYSIILNKKNQFIAKGLVKKYNKEDDKNIKEMVENYNKSPNGIIEDVNDVLKKINEIYKKFSIENIEVDKKYLNENNPERFLEKIFLSLDYPNDLLFVWYFDFRISFEDVKFKDVYKSLQEIFNIFKNYRLKDFVSENKEFKIVLDNLINTYSTVKIWWYKELIKKFEKNKISWSEKWYWMWYVKQQIINLYYPEVRKVLYYYDWKISYKDFFDLKANLKEEKLFSEDYKENYDRLLLLFSIIQKLYSSFFWPFIRPFVIHQLAYSTSFNKRDLLKLRYLLWFIISKNYIEFRNVYKFFSELINIKNSVYNLMKLYFINFILAWIILWRLLLNAPLIFVLWIILLILRMFYIYISSAKNTVWYNFALNSVIILLLVIWWLIFVKNFDTYVSWIKNDLKIYTDIIKLSCNDVNICRNIIDKIMTDILIIKQK